MKKYYKYFILYFILGLLVCFVSCFLHASFMLQKINHKSFSVQSLNYQSLIIHNGIYDQETSGERWLGQDLVGLFAPHYNFVGLLFLNSVYPDNRDDGVHLYLRGYHKFSPPFPDDNHILLAFVIYPLKFSKPHFLHKKHRNALVPYNLGTINYLFDEMQFYDAIAVASETYAKKMKDAGFNAYYVQQFTNTQKFYPDYDEKLKSEVLFVGANADYRRAAKIIHDQGLSIDIYGPNWSGLSKMDYVDNQVLHKYYSSAKIVLNEHRYDMRINGFINNRTFDVSASGGFLISDYMKEIEEVYGDCVPMWKTEEELVELVKYYLAPEHEAERLAKAKCARDITLKNFTSDIAAQKFMQIIDDIKKQKGL